MRKNIQITKTVSIRCWTTEETNIGFRTKYSGRPSDGLYMKDHSHWGNQHIHANKTLWFPLHENEFNENRIGQFPLVTFNRQSWRPFRSDRNKTLVFLTFRWNFGSNIVFDNSKVSSCQHWLLQTFVSTENVNASMCACEVHMESSTRTCICVTYVWQKRSNMKRSFDIVKKKKHWNKKSQGVCSRFDFVFFFCSKSNSIRYFYFQFATGKTIVFLVA